MQKTTRVLFSLPLIVLTAATACGGGEDDKQQPEATVGQGGSAHLGGSAGASDTNSGGASGSSAAGSSSTAGTAGDVGSNGGAGGQGGSEAIAGSAGQTAGAAGAGGAGAFCKPPYTGHTLQTLTAAATDGACSNDSDLLAVCSNDVNAATSTCGLPCLARDNEAEQLKCALQCVKQKMEPDASDACTACYLAAVQCAIENCRKECIVDPASEQCQKCRLDKGCTGDFFECSGLPQPKP